MSEDRTEWKRKVAKRLRVAVAVAAWLALAWLAWNGREDMRTAVMMKWAWCWMAVAVALAPVNWALEAWRWQVLCGGLERQRFWQSMRGVLVGYAGRVFTPFGLGEYPSRALCLSEGKRTMGMGLVVAGSYAQTVVMVAAGAVALCLTEELRAVAEQKTVVVMVAAIVVAAVVAGYFLFPRLLRRMERFKVVRAAGALGTVRLTGVLGIGVVRYAVMCAQMYCAVMAFGGDVAWADGLRMIAIYYLFVTFTPSLGVTDLASRGVLGAVVSGQCFGIAGMVTWVLNQGVAAVIGSALILPKGEKTIKNIKKTE